MELTCKYVKNTVLIRFSPFSFGSGTSRDFKENIQPYTVLIFVLNLFGSAVFKYYIILSLLCRFIYAGARRVFIRGI